MKYYINYHTGVGNHWIDGSLEEAKRIADKEAAYTQTDITIEDEEGNEISRRRWCGAEYDPEMLDDDQLQYDIIDFGKFGFYGDWIDLTD